MDKQDEARRAAELIGEAKSRLLDALRIAENAGLRWTARLDKLTGQAESVQRLYSKQALK